MEEVFWSDVLRLLAASLCGAAVGFQRERYQQPAGLRTHMIVSLGAALITIVGSTYKIVNGADDAHVAAQIVTGIGFLGAGTILKEGPTIRGLTTAASIWTCAGIGMACGRGGEVLWLGVVATVLVMVTLGPVNQWGDRVELHRRLRQLTIRAPEEAMEPILRSLIEMRVEVQQVVRGSQDVEGVEALGLHILLPSGVPPSTVLASVMSVPGVRFATWDPALEKSNDAI